MHTTAACFADVCIGCLDRLLKDNVQQTISNEILAAVQCTAGESVSPAEEASKESVRTTQELRHPSS